MENNVKLSVIIACFNGAGTIEVQLEALADQEWPEPWEIIVSDNGSTDNSMEIVKKYMKVMPRLRIVDASARRGQPYALNTGIAAALGESIVLCDADDEVGKGWVGAMGRALTQNDLVACRMDISKLNRSWVVKSRQNPQNDGVQRFTCPPYLPHAAGATLGVRRSLFEKIGGFDEDFPLLHDSDFCWKAQLMGAKLVFVPDAVVHYRFRDDLAGIFRQARGYGEYEVKLYKKYRPLGMPKLLLKSGVKAWIYLVKRTFSVRTKGQLGDFMWQVGYRMGRVKGAIKHKVLVV